MLSESIKFTRTRFERASNWLGGAIDRLQLPEPFILILVSIVVGVGTGLGAVAFVWLLRQISELTLSVVTILGEIPGRLVMMGLAGLVVGYMVSKWASEAKGHGVPEVMEAVALRGGIIRPVVAAVKVLASSITIGTGGSAGREGPIVQVGSALGSTIGQLLRFSHERIRTLVACGAAAGIAATFNAPIAGAIFALEVILGRFTSRYFGAVVISSVSAAIVGRVLLGDRPAFEVPAYPLVHLEELFIYLALGLLSALVAVAFVRLLYWLEGLFEGWKAALPLKAALGMLLTAGVAALLPGQSVLGPGLEFIGEAIRDDFQLSIGLMVALIVLKMLATSFTLGAGNSGGVFAPSLFMGAILGGLVGGIAQRIWPGVVVHPGAYAIVGMAAVFAGAARAPITAILIVFEMSNDYRLILPVMLATVISTLVAELIFHESIYTLKLKLRGITLQQGRDMDILQGVHVSEVMSEGISVPEDMPLFEAMSLMNERHYHGFPVLDSAGRLCGIVTVSDLDRALAQSRDESDRVGDICTPYERLLVAYPDETIDDVLSRMSTRGLGRLPVVTRGEPRRIAGMIRREDIMEAYHLARTRRGEIQQRSRQMELRNIDGTEFMEFALTEGDAAVGKSLKEIGANLPSDCLIVSIRRGGRAFIPRGNTRIEVGDLITAFARQGVRDQIVTHLQGTGPAASLQAE